MHPLQAIGLPASADDAYLVLVEGGALTLAELAEVLGMSPREATEAVARLSALGLVETVPGDGDAPTTVRACPPGASLESLADDRVRQAAALRESSEALSRFWRHHHPDSAGYVEVVRTAAAIEAVKRRVHDEATRCVRGLSIGLPVNRSGRVTILDGALEAMADGVEYKVVYRAQALNDPDVREIVQTCVRAGEQARVFPDLPLSLTICDEDFCVVNIPLPRFGRAHAMIVRRSELLDAFIGVFESYWRLGVPLPAGDDSVGTDADASANPPEDARRLLTCLSSGLTDESIARELGVSERTIARRIARLQEIVGAQTRFQLGVQATRRGWL
ncbi:helix-turn-helix domain-containing protein [Streptomyces sp. NPDC021012]|uniref:helix-turn-helix domain-containing protein n=1 Tax=Streptomyces sp. NPDC021012 TaxID=3365107 RepID=UPI0037BC34A6